MRFVLLLAFAFTGCLDPITKRLDTANARVGRTNELLGAQNQKSVGIAKRLDAVNDQLADTRRELAETNARIERLEKRLDRVPGLQVPRDQPQERK